MKRTFSFGKISYTNKSRRINEVTVDVELRQCGGKETFTIDRHTGEKTITGHTPTYMELSIVCAIWNASHTDWVCGGQCLDTIIQYKDQLNDLDTFDTIYEIGKKYHLNSMHAGTPEQEKAVEEWKSAGNRYDYTAICEMLKEKGLYEVNFTGLTIGKRFNNEPYKYGQGWVIQELPEDVLCKIRNMISA